MVHEDFERQLTTEMGAFSKTLFFTIWVALTSCHAISPTLLETDSTSPRNQDSFQKGTFRVQFSKATPDLLSLEDTSCNPESVIQNIEQVNAFAKNKFLPTIQETILFFSKAPSFSKVSGDGLQNSAISQTLVGYHLHTQYADCVESNALTFQCNLWKQETILKGKRIQFCKTHFSSHSLENAALVSAAGILQGARLMSELFPEIKLPKVELLVAPVFETTVHTSNANYTMVSTDNAFWSNFSSSRFVIAIFPSSVQTHPPFFTPLWQQLAISTHEFGHHVFHALAPSLFRRKTIKTNSTEDGIEEAVDYVQSNVTTRNISFPLVISALNEGFADLMAHYAFEEEQHPHSGIEVGKIRFGRDITRTKYDDGQEKSLSEKVLQQFLALQRSPPQNGFATDYQDIHTIGAILASGLDGLFSEKNFQEKNQEKLYKKNMKLAVQWVQKLEKNLPFQILKPDDFFQRAIALAIDVASVAPNRLLPAQCAVVENVFPVFEKELLGAMECKM